MKVINTAIIGQGRSGRDIHGKYLITDPELYKIVAAVDLLPERRALAAKEYNCPVYKDYRELFKRRDIDLIVNATFSHLHTPITLDCLKAGFNVLCEKPLASSVKDVDKLIAAAKKSKKVFAIFQQSRFAPYFSKVREVIASGVLGRIVKVAIEFNGFSRRWDWQTWQGYNGGSLLNTGPHPLDQGLVLFGKGMPEVRCYMDLALTSGNAEDYVLLNLSGRGHPLITIEISSCCAYPTTTYNVQGDRGGMRATTSSAEWKYFNPAECPPRKKMTLDPLRDANGLPMYPREQLVWHEGKWPEAAPAAGDGAKAYSPATAASSNMTGMFYAMLHRTITTGARLEVTPDEVRRQIAVIEECRRQNPHIYRKRGR